MDRDGAQLEAWVVEGATGAAAGRCAVHPDAPATATCDRCGNYACDMCHVPVGLEGSVCSGCEERQRHELFQSAGRTASVLMVLLAAYAVLQVGSALSSLAQIELLERMAMGTFTDAEVEANDLREMAFGFATFGVFVIAGVFFAIWMRRTNLALRRCGAELEFGPNAWGWFFCPFLNLYKPYQAVRELHAHASGSLTIPWFLPTWWALWLLSAVLGHALWRMDGTTIDGLIRSSWVTIADATVGIVLTAFAWQVVRSALSPRAGRGGL